MPPPRARSRSFLHLSLSLSHTSPKTYDQSNQKPQTKPKSKQDAFFARIGKQAIYQGAGLPAAATGLKKVVSNTPGLEELGKVPLAVLAPLLGTTMQSVRALIPI
jgi:hypothetical protein